MGFDQKKTEDVFISSEGIDIVFESKYKELLQGAVLDYADIEQGQMHFIFLNPNDPHYTAPKEQS